MGWQTDIFPLLIVISGSPFTGLFVYSPGPGHGNLVASIAAQAGTDPYGNPYKAGITSYDNVFGGVTEISGALIQLFSAAGLLQAISPSGYVIYSPAPAAAGNVVESIAPAAFTDSFGNAILAGLTTYTTSAPFIASQVFNGKLQFYTAASQAGPWTANGPLVQDLAGALSFLSGTQNGASQAALTMTGAASVAGITNGFTGAIGVAEQALPPATTNAPLLFGNTLGHWQTVSDTNNGDGNTYDVERLTLILGGATTITTTGQDVFTKHLGKGKYVVEVWMVTSNTIAADTATWGFTFSGTNAVPTLMKFESKTAGTAVVGYGASGTLTTTFAGQNFAGNQDVYMRLTVNVSVAGTLAIHGVTGASTVTVFAGAVMEIRPVVAS